MNSGNHFMQFLKKDQNKILCLAKNYLKQAIAKGATDLPPYPLVFQKPFSSLLFEPDPIKIKSQQGHIVDHESK